MAPRRERLVVAGGVAAGMSAAARARRLNPDAEIIVYEASGHVTYGACGLPYLISGVVRDPADLVTYTPEYLSSRRHIRALVRHTVLAVDPRLQEVTVRDATGSVSQVAYDRFILATGGRAARPPIPGADLPGAFTLRTLDDGLAIQEFLRARQPRRAAILGGGYVGLEMAEAFRALGLEVTLIEQLPQVMAALDPELAELVAAEAARHGVQLLLGQSVTALEANRGAAGLVHTSAGAAIHADLVLLAAGVQPSAGLAQAAGLALGRTGAVQVNDRMETSDPRIWAAGDVAEVRHIVSGQAAWVPLGTTANKQGRVAGENAVGGSARFPGVVGTAVVKLFDLEVARTGLHLAEAAAAGFQPVAATVRHRSRAGYYPGGAPMTVRLVLDRPTGRVLGGQLVGAEGAARRVDVIAAALHTGMTVEQFAELDLGYAPPFAPVWDPLLLAARQGLKDLGLVSA